MSFNQDFHINCLTSNPQTKNFIEQILNAEEKMSEEIITYKRNFNNLKGLMISSNKKMKKKVHNTICDAEMRMESYLDVFETKMIEIDAMYNKKITEIADKCDSFYLDMVSEMERKLENRMRKLDEIIAKSCNDFDSNYFENKLQLERLIIDVFNKKTREMNTMISTYKKNIKKMYQDFREEHHNFKEGVKTAYPAEIVESMLTDITRCDIAGYVEGMFSEKERRLHVMERNIEKKILQIDEMKGKMITGSSKIESFNDNQTNYIVGSDGKKINSFNHGMKYDLAIATNRRKDEKKKNVARSENSSSVESRKGVSYKRKNSKNNETTKGVHDGSTKTNDRLMGNQFKDAHQEPANPAIKKCWEDILEYRSRKKFLIESFNCIGKSCDSPPVGLKQAYEGSSMNTNHVLSRPRHYTKTGTLPPLPTLTSSDDIGDICL